jgi:hypothetical protein
MVLGDAYDMLLQERWQKVRLSHVSPGRAFFVFTHGDDHQKTVSMTARMLKRICESGRLRAIEAAPLVERASERVREHLVESPAPASAPLHGAAITPPDHAGKPANGIDRWLRNPVSAH